MSIRDVMTSGPATLTPDQPVSEAARAMSEGDFGAVVVVENGGSVRGILTDRDVRRLPVVEGSEVVGIVSIGDLAQARDEKSALVDICAAEPNH